MTNPPKWAVEAATAVYIELINTRGDITIEQISKIIADAAPVKEVISDAESIAEGCNKCRTTAESIIAKLTGEDNTT